MLIYELFEAIGRNDYHPESFYAPIVADFINDEGVAYWEDIYAQVELVLDDKMTMADKSPPGPNQPPRWKKIIGNLHANRSLEGGRFGDIVRIKGGFATRKAAKDQGIPILADNNATPRNPGNRSPQDIKKKVGPIVNAAWNELGKPKLSNIGGTRNEIEDMIKMEPWLDDDELIAKAKDIIYQNMR